MSPPSPRRSSRARPTGASQPPPSSTSSANNSIVSGRLERGGRSVKAASPVKSEASVSKTPVDDEDDDEPATAPTTRRSNRRHIEDHQDSAIVDDDADDDDEAVSGSIVDEDGETTRCICGHQEYPGPPIDFFAQPTVGGHVSRGSRHSISIATTEVAEEGSEPGSLFIQCDVCSVWQHGGCVGIASQSATPKDYFCEKCRPEFHSLHRNPAG
jgi:PHD-finger